MSKLRLNAYGNRRMMTKPVVEFAQPRNGKVKLVLSANLTQEELALLGPDFTEPVPEVAEPKKKSEISPE